jgi:hypothetical protein
MGWLFMRSLGRFRTPGAYLDDQITCDRPEIQTRVLRSAVVKIRTYYAALEVLRPDRELRVVGIVCLIKYNLRDKEGFIFGYKDMDEDMGPCEAECPAAVLDLLTVTTNENALNWRATCRLRIAQRAAVPRLRNRDVIEFEESITFVDGTTHRRMEVWIDPRRPRTIRFRAGDGWSAYRIGDLRRRPFTVVGGGGEIAEAVAEAPETGPLRAPSLEALPSEVA